MKIEHVAGKKKADVMLYALSTCAWCKKTKQYLNELGVEYRFVFVDLLPDEDKDEAVEEIRRWNPACSFPTIVIDNTECMVGFKPDELKKKLG